jgi:predicted GNAT family N-acyltransferase
MKVQVQLLNKSHVRTGFECGKALLDNYIRTQASQDVKRDLSACYVMTEEGKSEVVGYYTLSSNSIERTTFPANMIARLPPSYGDLPTILMGRLAVDNKIKGKRLGEYLLINALNKCVEVSQTIGALAVVVDPIDERAEEFYSGYGFIFLPGSKKMFLPIKTIEESFLPTGK